MEKALIWNRGILNVFEQNARYLRRFSETNFNYRISMKIRPTRKQASPPKSGLSHNWIVWVFIMVLFALLEGFLIHKIFILAFCSILKSISDIFSKNCGNLVFVIWKEVVKEARHWTFSFTRAWFSRDRIRQTKKVAWIRFQVRLNFSSNWHRWSNS